MNKGIIKIFTIGGKMKLKSLIISLAFLAAVSLSGSEYYDGVIAVVNGIPIVHSDVMKKFYMIKKNKKITQIGRAHV